MQMFRNVTILMACVLVIFTSCKDENDSIIPITKEKITGFAQKGPFNNGSSVLISEMNSDFIQTGKTLTSNIENNRGLYEIDNIEFISQYVILTVNGFYFNEISGNNSSAQLTLYAISDLSDKNSLNVNVLSSIEKQRVEFLISEGMDFKDAKNQAMSEILAIFEIDSTLHLEAETLDISKDSEGNAILLAISSILQGYRNTADLSLLLANLSTDIKADGILDDLIIKSDLLLHAKSLDLASIRTNLEEHYHNQGIDYTIPDFEQYVQQFMENTDYEPHLIEYPEYGNYGKNLLYMPGDTIFTEQDYSLAADLPENGSLKIVLKNGLWMIYGTSSVNWDISDYDNTTKSQTFSSSQAGLDCDLKIFIPVDSLGNNSFEIEYYEFNSLSPTHVKYIATVNR